MDSCRYKQTQAKGSKIFLTQCKLINVEWMMELENQHLTTSMVIIAFGKNHQGFQKTNG